MSRKTLSALVILMLLLLSVAVMLCRHHGSNGVFFGSSTGNGAQQWSPFYRKTVQMHRRQDPLVPDGAIVVIGDSLVQGLAVQNLGANSVNYGIAGDTTAGVLNRLRWYASLTRARLIIVAIGVNDISRLDARQSIANYARIVDALPDGVPVILSLVLPVDEQPMGLTGFTDAIERLNAAQHELCRARDGVHCLDISSQISTSGVLNPAYHTGDGLHLNDTGNRIWLDAMTTLAALLPDD